MFWGGGVGSAGVVWLFPWDAPCLGFFAAPGISVQQVETCACYSCTRSRSCVKVCLFEVLQRETASPHPSADLPQNQVLLEAAQISPSFPSFPCGGFLPQAPVNNALSRAAHNVLICTM